MCNASCPYPLTCSQNAVAGKTNKYYCGIFNKNTQELNKLSGNELNYLIANDTRNLSNKLSNINALTPIQISSIEDALIPLIPDTLIPKILPKQISAFKIGQIAKFTQRQIPKFIETQIRAFKLDQIPAFTSDQIDAFTSDQIAKFSVRQKTAFIKPLEGLIVQPNTIYYQMTGNQSASSFVPVTYSEIIRNIGSNYQLSSTSKNWDPNRGVFTVSVDGVYLISATFSFNNKNSNNIYMHIYNTSNNKTRICVSDSDGFTTGRIVTYNRVEQLNKGDNVYFTSNESSSKYVLFFNNDNDSHTNITITKLNIMNHYSLIDNNSVYASEKLQPDSFIGSNNKLVTNSQNVWDNKLGIFTVSNTGIYLTTGSFLLEDYNLSDNTFIYMYRNNYILLRYIADHNKIVTGQRQRLVNFLSVDNFNAGDTIYFQVINPKGQININFGNNLSSNTNITFTQLSADNIYYKFINDMDNVITINYTNTMSISNSKLSTTIQPMPPIQRIPYTPAPEWNPNGTFTVKKTGIYLINITFFIKSKDVGLFGLYINDVNNLNIKIRYCLSDIINIDTVRTYTRVEFLNEGENVFFARKTSNKLALSFEKEYRTQLSLSLIHISEPTRPY